MKSSEIVTHLYRWIVVHGKKCAYVFTVNSYGTTVKEASGTFAATTSSLTVETLAVSAG